MVYRMKWNRKEGWKRGIDGVLFHWLYMDVREYIVCDRCIWSGMDKKWR